MDTELSDYRDNDQFENPYVVRCILIGNHGVGKSTLANVFSTGVFDPTIASTIGIAFVSKTMVLPNYNNHRVKLQVWDTAGTEKFKSIVRQYLRDAFIAVIAFDMTNRESWNEVDQWKSDLDIDDSYDSIPLIVLVGTKSDRRNWVVSSDEIKQKAKEWGCKFYVVSSKQANSTSMIYRMFAIAVEDLHRRFVNEHIMGHELPPGVKKDTGFDWLSESDKEKSSFCCYQ